MGYRVVRVQVKNADRKVLESWLRAPTTPQALATRARIILASLDGEPIRPMAKRLGVSVNTVNVWRRRYRVHGLAGLRTRERSGRPRQISEAQERAVVTATMRRPKTTTHWSARRLAKEVGLSAATVHRIWQKYGLQPHRVESFKFSKDPAFGWHSKRRCRKPPERTASIAQIPTHPLSISSACGVARGCASTWQRCGSFAALDIHTDNER